MFARAKGKQQKKFWQLLSGTVYWSYLTLPFGIVGCTFLPTTFLEIAVNVLIFAQKNAENLKLIFFSVYSYIMISL